MRFLMRLAMGAVSGVVATGVMTAAMGCFQQLGLLGEPPPRRITRRLSSFAFGPFRPRGASLDAAALGAHFAFGASMGAVYGVVPRPLRSPAGSVVFGAAVWAANYAGWLPKAGLMPSPGRDRPGRPASMLASHLVFGAALSAMYDQLRRFG
jgi:hypothetical protein